MQTADDSHKALDSVFPATGLAPLVSTQVKVAIQISPRPGTPGRGVRGEGLQTTCYLNWQNAGNYELSAFRLNGVH
jgi:hypothetical protein